VLLIVLLTFLGIKALPAGAPLPAGGDSSRGRAEPTKQGGSQDAAGHQNAPGGSEISSTTQYWYPLQHYWNPGILNKALPKDSPPWPGFPDIPGHELEFLIACVPDPTDSHSGDRFDNLIDALQRAVETQQYVLDRFWFPWKQPQGTP